MCILECMIRKKELHDNRTTVFQKQNQQNINFIQKKNRITINGTFAVAFQRQFQESSSSPWQVPFLYSFRNKICSFSLFRFNILKKGWSQKYVVTNNTGISRAFLAIAGHNKYSDTGHIFDLANFLLLNNCVSYHSLFIVFIMVAFFEKFQVFCDFENIDSTALHLLIDMVESTEYIGHVRQYKNELRIFQAIRMTMLGLSKKKRANSTRMAKTKQKKYLSNGITTKS